MARKSWKLIKMTKNKNGRPRKYKEEYNKQAQKLCIIFGADDKKLAEYFAVHESTINKWKLNYPKFSESIKRGKDVYDVEHVEASLLERAVGYQHPDVQFFAHQGKVTDKRTITKHYPPETTAAIFWLKNRHPKRWKDVKKTVLSGNLGISFKDGLDKVRAHLKTHPADEKKLLEELEDSDEE